MNLYAWRRRLARRAVALLVLTMAADPTALARDRRPLRMQELDQVSVELREMAAIKRQEAIERLEPLAKSASGEMRAEMMLRLAELYVQHGRYLYLSEMEACGERDDCDHRASRSWQESSVALYQQVLRGYPRYERADQATYFLGAVLEDLGRRDEATETLRQLVKVYPESDYVPDAYLLLGDFFFDAGDAWRSLQAFQKAASFPDHAHHSYALYRLGWCQHNVGDDDAALRSLQQVIELSSQEEAEEVPGSFALGEQALGDLVQFYADADRIGELRSYLTRIGRTDLLPGALRRLATALVERGQREQAIDTLRQLVLERPDHPDNPALGLEIVEQLDHLGQRDDVLRELAQLRATGASPELDELHRKLAARWHERARQHDRSRQPDALELYRQAGELYQAQLDSFPQSPGRVETLYLHGELLYRLGQHGPAYERYSQVVELDPQGPRSRFCAEAAIHAAEEQIRAEGGAVVPPKPTPARNIAPQPLTEWEQRYVDACARYARLFPDGKVQEALYRSAYLLYARYRFDESAALFREVVARDPKTAEARLAADLILDALAIREDWDALATTAAAFAQHPSLGDKLFRADLHKIHLNAEFKRIEAAKAEGGSDLVAAQQFEAYAQKFPEAPNVALAENNAGVYYAAAGQIGAAMAVREQLIARGETPWLRDTVAELGFDKERTADWAGAATLYERLWTLPPQDERASTALFSAALLRLALGELPQAQRDTQLLSQALPDDRRTVELELAIVRKLEEPAMILARCDAFDDAPPSSATPRERYWMQLQAAKALQAQGKADQAEKRYQELVQRWKAEGAPLEAVEEVAWAMLGALQTSQTAYEALQIRTSGTSAARQDAALKASLARKLQALLALETELQQVVELGAGLPGLLALSSVGAAYEELGVALAESDRPSYLTASQLDDYERKLEDYIYLQQQKAHAAYQLVRSRSQELGLPGAHAAHALQRAAALRPDEHVLGEELLPSVPRLASSAEPRPSYETTLTARDPASPPTSDRPHTPRPPRTR